MAAAHKKFTGAEGEGGWQWQWLDLRRRSREGQGSIHRNWTKLGLNPDARSPDLAGLIIIKALTVSQTYARLRTGTVSGVDPFLYVGDSKFAEFAELLISYHPVF